MEKSGIGHHISQQFNTELEAVRNRVLLMGGLVEEQIQKAVTALSQTNADLADEVINKDVEVNAMEVAIDEECCRILARRQPAAGDLRLVLAVIKTIADLERIGDLAERIGRMTLHLAKGDQQHSQLVELRHMGDNVGKMLHDALDSFARMDAEAAAAVAQRDVQIDKEYDALMRQLITFMMEDPRSIKRALDMVWSARALERIGDHARNICEYVVYLVKGKDVRHTTLEQLEQEAKG